MFAKIKNGEQDTLQEQYTFPWGKLFHVLTNFRAIAKSFACVDLETVQDVSLHTYGNKVLTVSISLVALNSG